MPVQESIYWVYFHDMVKKIKTDRFKKVDELLKKKINEIFEITHYGLFQYQILKDKPLINIDDSSISEICKYITNNYSRFFEYLNYNNSKTSVYSSKLTKNELEEISFIIENISIRYIADNLILTNNNNYNSDFLTLLLIELSKMHRFDTNFLARNNDKIVYHSLVYPLFLTMLVIDITNEAQMFNNIKRIYTKQNILNALKSGRPLSSNELNYFKSHIDILEYDEEWNTFLLNFKQENWTSFSVEKKYKLVFQLAKYTALFLKDRIKSVWALSDGEEIFDSFYNYINLFLVNKTSSQTSTIYLTNKIDPLNKNYDETDRFLLPFLIKDYNPIQIGHHISSLKDYSKFVCDKDRIIDFLDAVLLSTNYINLIDILKVDSNYLADFLIQRKKLALVDTLHLYKLNDHNIYKKQYNSINLEDLKFNQDVLKEIIKKDFRIEVLKTNNQFVNMLKIISLILSLVPSTARRYNYSWELIVKYFIITFGPYKRKKALYDKKTINEITYKISKLLSNFKHVKNKDDYSQTLLIIHKLENFKN
ncbi:hypothetical protein MNF30_03055 [Mycoplasma mycoides subsp. capri]|uniref:hypothetical protein n=1 Tax=Mycoplasma mycoides TaxID=2102 RepID=UPI002240DBFD|nr:hypothetical protein [Mycoplasma mycoides]UZK63919.1 hypothetical protein MNF30_03055 [Mycoplasma mycoides subsp. capri]